MIEERDISVTMRDGTRLAVDVYRSDAHGRYSAQQGHSGARHCGHSTSQPAHAPLWFGPIAAGDTRRFVANDYVHVISQPRGSAKSEGHYGEITPVKPGEVVEYQIQILATANQFKTGHRICLDITSMDVPTGTGAMTNVEYIPYHVCSSKTVTHRIYRDAERPSHLLLPIIPDPTDQRPA